MTLDANDRAEVATLVAKYNRAFDNSQVEDLSTRLRRTGCSCRRTAPLRRATTGFATGS